MMWIAWTHNPQGEIYSEGVINWPYWLGIGISWQLAISAVSLTLLYIVYRLGLLPSPFPKK